MLSSFVSPFDATVVRKMLRESGGVGVGKTNMDEYAIGSGCIDSFYGPSVNPWGTRLFSCKDGDRETPVEEGDFFVAGGSSGGSAVAVASGAVFASLGTDTGGSNRYPAALTGIVGFKPTYGLLSRHGLIPLSHTLDTVGIMTRSCRDASLVFDCLRGFDESDSTSSRNQELVSAFQDDVDMTSVRIGVPQEYLSFDGMSQEVLDLIEEVSDLFVQLGSSVTRVSLPNTKYASSCYTVLNAAELASNFSCYDGIQYGHHSSHESESSEKTRESLYAVNRSQGFGDAVKGRIQAGNFFLLKSNYESYVKPAHQARRLVYQDFVNVFRRRQDNNHPNESFLFLPEEINNNDIKKMNREEINKEKVDILLTPMTRGPAKRYSEWRGRDNRELAANEDVLAQPANISGFPAVTLPVKVSLEERLPLAVQLIAPAFQDNFLLSVAQRLEERVNFPPLRFLADERRE